MTINVLQLICPSGYYGAERWVNALLSVPPSADVMQHLAITAEPGVCDEVLLRCGLPLDRQHRVAMSSKFDLRVVQRLVQLIRRHNITIIHTHGYKSDILGVLAAKWAGIKAICTPHGFENATDKKLQAYMWLGGKAFHWFDWVCPLSPDIMNTLLTQYRVKPHKIKLINNGVDLSEVERALAASDSQKSAKFTIGYIGQLISRKNIPATIAAFAEFHQAVPASELILIGDGDERIKLEQQVAELGLTDAVQFMGFRDDRLRILPSFDCFVLTSSLEGIPRCLMEAMAAGVCVTAFDIPGVDRLIEHEQTGLLAEFNNTDLLQQQWLRLTDDAKLKQQLAAAGKQYVYKHFSAEAMASAYNALYQDIITKP